MEDSIRRQIIGIRSKYCEPILELLYREGELYHGDLADKLDMSPSGLNVIIKKMQECDPPIIEILQIGKYKIYTLPPAVKEYMENRKSENKGLEEKAGIAGDLKWEGENNVLLCLQHFADKAGKQWKEAFNLLLQGSTFGEDTEVQEQFTILMKAIVNADKYCEEEIDRLKEFIHNDVLNQMIQEYLDEVSKCEKYIEQIGSERLKRHIIIQ